MRGRVHLSFRSPTAEAGLDPYSDVRCAGKPGRRVCRRLVSENRMGAPPSQRIPRLFGRGSWLEVRRITDLLRAETAGGMLLVGLRSLRSFGRIRRGMTRTAPWAACGSGRLRCIYI